MDVDRRLGRARREGQTVMEVAVLSPFFFFLVFALAQVAHLGLAVAIVNYGASSAARLAVEQNDPQGTNASFQFKKILTAGLTFVNIQTRPVDQDGVTQNVEVTACAQVPAYPWVGEFLYPALPGANGTDCAEGAKMMGPVGLKGPAPYHFIIEGQAKARMNYQKSP